MPERRIAIAFELADDGSRVKVVAAGEPQPLDQHAEVDPVRLLPVDDRMQRAVDVQEHPVSAAPVRQRLVRGEAADEVVVHDDRRAELLRVLGALEHLLDVGAVTLR